MAPPAHLLLLLSITLLLFFSFTSPTLSCSSSGSSDNSNADFAIVRINETISATAKLAKFLQKMKKKYHSQYDTGALNDCRELLVDARSSMKDSIKALKKYNKDGEQTHVSDAQTWMSAALTNVDTCYDGIKESSSQGLKEAVGEKMEDVENQMSVSLGLVNDLNY